MVRRVVVVAFGYVLFGRVSLRCVVVRLGTVMSGKVAVRWSGVK